MISARGTRTVSIKRKKTGLDFSIKGGKEHGIGVVVSWIKEGGAASSVLRLGDEVLAVNAHSVQGLTHPQVVGLLKNGGPLVSLLVRPNQTLEDIFSNSSLPPPSSLQDKSRPVSPFQRLLPSSTEDNTHQDEQPLPAGWSGKTDHKTGRKYFENHHTQTSTWCDPRTIKPLPLEEFQWNSLPPGWERFLDAQGDLYYANHHTQTTHWDSPSGSRHQLLLQQLSDFLQQQTDKMKVVEESLAGKRKLLLEKSQRLSLLPEAQQHLEEEEEGESSVDLIEDMMLLNEEAESSEEELASLRKHVQTILSIFRRGQQEDMGEKDEQREAAELSVLLVGKLSSYQHMIESLNTLVQSVSADKETSDTPLQYMLQLPIPMEEEKLKEKQQWLHVLPDKLTPKTTTELQLEAVLLEEGLKAGRQLQHKLNQVHAQTLGHTSNGPAGISWEIMMEQLASLDFQLVQDSSNLSDLSFQEKLAKLLTF